MREREIDGRECAEQVRLREQTHLQDQQALNEGREAEEGQHKAAQGVLLRRRRRIRQPQAVSCHHENGNQSRNAKGSTIRARVGGIKNLEVRTGNCQQCVCGEGGREKD